MAINLDPRATPVEPVTPILTFAPKIDPEAPAWLRQNLTLIYQKLGNHTQAMALLSREPSVTTTSTIIEGFAGGGGGGGSATIGGVDNQSGVTTYATMAGDYGALVVLADASPIAVTLNTQTPPWFCWIANLGAGTATLAPFSGTINGGASFALLPNTTAVVAFDGTNWWAGASPIVPVNTPGTAHEWIASYDAATGVFTLSQPAFTDISGVATTVQIGTGTPSAGEYVDGGTGAWTALPSSGPSVISINAQTASYAALVGDLGKIIQMNSASATTVTLPVTFATGFWLWVKNVGAGTCTASATSGNIDGHASIAIVQAQAYQFYWDGSLWRQLSQSLSV